MPNLIHASKSPKSGPTSDFLSELSKLLLSYTCLGYFIENKLFLKIFQYFLSSGMPELPQECLFPGSLNWTDSDLTDRIQYRIIYTRNNILFRSRGFVMPSQPNHVKSNHMLTEAFASSSRAKMEINLNKTKQINHKTPPQEQQDKQVKPRPQSHGNHQWSGQEQIKTLFI